ncbi:MAG TPA: CBS domain-containing protein [Pyrinomonadaceae bacterium]|nr:CBS domain-containing protein [Pyrinomonadaceae bacterium]
MLSNLLRFRLVDERGRSARLADLAVAHLEGDYPKVTRLLFFNESGERKSLAWKSVRSVEGRERLIHVRDLEAGSAIGSAPLQDEALLRAEVLDALVLDLQNRRATRANDLCLEEENGGLLLRSADTSMSAVLRRLTRGLYKHVSDGALYDWKYVEFLRGDPQAARHEAGRHLRITRLPPGEIALLTNQIPYLHSAELLILLPDPLAADTLESMLPERQLQVFEELDEEQAARIVALMAPDNAADLVGRLNIDEMRSLLHKLPKERSERIIDLLRYPEDTVGGIMTNDMVTVARGLTIAEAREDLREKLKGPDFVFYVYAVESEENQKLCGLLSLRNLLTEEDCRKLEEIMDPFVSTLDPLDSAVNAAYRVIDSGLAAMPVVAREGKIIGIVPVDVAIEQIAPGSAARQLRIFS